jgi:hypothetical protein
MHRSRLCAVVIDCEKADLDAASRFFGSLGRPERAREGNYVTLEDRANQLLVLLQRVNHPSRVHLDIESDDVEAEVRRLEALRGEADRPGRDVVGARGAHGPALLRRAPAARPARGRREHVALRAVPNSPPVAG